MSLLLAVYNGLLALLPGQITFGVRRFYLNHTGLTIQPGARINVGVHFYGPWVTIGKDTWIGPDVRIHTNAIAGVQIGANVDIAPSVVISSGTHDIGTRFRRAGNGAGEPVVVGDGTWIGTGSVLLAGARIGTGSIVAGGSVVIRGTYPDNVLLAGVPAVVKRNLSADDNDASVAYNIVY
jgi:maltose O-acetyltransferase